MKNRTAGNNIVIIGAGLGGLSAGILLSRLQFNVTIVEKNRLPGGLMRSYRRAGVECPVGVHYVGALGAEEPLGKMFRFLGVNAADLFERTGQDGIIDRYIFDDFTFDLPAGIDNYENNLLAFFPGDAVAVRIIMRNLRDIAQSMFQPSFLINQGDPFRNIDYFTPLGEYLRRLNVSRDLQAVLAVPAQLIGVPAELCPIIFHHMVLAGYLFSCWRLKENGSCMTDAFVRRFAELGGKLILNDAVTEIMHTDRKIAGLKLKSGGKLPAAAVVAAIHPKALLGLIAPQAMRDSFRERVLHLQETEGVIVAQISVDAAAHRELPYNIYRLHTDETGAISDGVFYQLRRGDTDKVNLLSIITKSLFADWLPWEKTQSGARGAEYVQKKTVLAEAMLRKASDLFGGMLDAHLVDVFTPLTVRDYVNCPEGSCYGVMHSSRQLMKIASLNNIPLSGLYLAGQNVVAPGVFGTMLGSFNAARQIIGAERLTKELNAIEKQTG